MPGSEVQVFLGEPNMKVYYRDEYFTDLYVGDSDVVPTNGSKVSLDDFDYIVKDVTFHPEQNSIEIILTELAEREIKPTDNSGRLNTMEAAIFAVSKRQDELQKKHRNLRDQISNVKTGLNQKAYNESKK